MIGFLVFMLIVLFGLLMLFKYKAIKGDIKEDKIEFDTHKTVQQIKDVLRQVRCNMQRLEFDDDPLADDNEIMEPAIALLLHGKATILDTFKHIGAGKSEWGVQIIVYDYGDKRNVIMTALGESAMGAAWAGYASGTSGLDYVNMRHSKDYRDRIAQMIA